MTWLCMLDMYLGITTLWARFTVLVTDQGHVVTEQPPPLEVDTSGASSSKANHNSNNYRTMQIFNQLREAGISLRRPARFNSTSRLGVVPSRHHVIQHMNVNGGMIRHTVSDHVLHVLVPTEHLGQRNPTHPNPSRYVRKFLCKVWLLACVAIVKLSSGLVVAMADTDICPPLCHTHVCVHGSGEFPEIQFWTHTVFKPFPRLNLLLLVSWVPILLLNFENQCQISSFFLAVYNFH